MRIVGRKSELLPTSAASGEALMRAASFNEMMQSIMPYGKIGCIPKGIYRFKTHEEANRQQDECLVRHMAKIQIKINKLIK
ncbi:MAG: hypothetical protein Q7U78_14465 [Gallionella sp.]|nr:hypothetical protein [Gallionella sp.]